MLFWKLAKVKWRLKNKIKQKSHIIFHIFSWFRGIQNQFRNWHVLDIFQLLQLGQTTKQNSNTFVHAILRKKHWIWVEYNKSICRKVQKTYSCFKTYLVGASGSIWNALIALTKQSFINISQRYFKMLQSSLNLTSVQVSFTFLTFPDQTY